MIKKFKPYDVQYHRNGVGGRGFYTVRFSFENEGKFEPNMLATVPSNAEPGECFVISVNDPTSKWRGDRFERDAKRAIEDYNFAEAMAFEARAQHKKK